MKSKNRFRIENACFQSFGHINLPLATSRVVATINLLFSLLTVDVPAFIGMDVIDREQLVAGTFFHHLAHMKLIKMPDGYKGYADIWIIPLIRAPSRHVYVPFDGSPRVHLTLSKIAKIHKKSFLPSPLKLFRLLKRYRLENATLKTLKIHEEIFSSCDPSQRI